MFFGEGGGGVLLDLDLDNYAATSRVWLAEFQSADFSSCQFAGCHTADCVILPRVFNDL